MRSHPTGAADRKSIARTSLFGIAILIALAITPIMASGCGETPPRSQTPSSDPTQSAEMTTVTQVTNERSLHERVMAEQGRGSGIAAASNPTITTAVASGTQSIASTSADPSAERDGPTSVVLAGGQTALKGIWSGTAERLASFLLKVCPSPRFTVPTSVLAGYYVRYCAEAGLRADLLWAQMIHETGYGIFGGDVTPEQNNYGGIGATGSGAPGVAFTTAEAGVMAQVAHMVAYVYTSSAVAWASETVDPRFGLVGPRGVVSLLSDLDGRWAVPGTGYGETIEAIARAINSD
jgi:Mannosyl-glycoprotein endo-beta-N-acetylglucosaminidase